MKRIFTLLIVSLVIFASCSDDERTKEEYKAWLEETYAELKGVSESVECVNIEEWSIVEVGQNACGHPLHYLPVHQSANTILFQKQVEGYTKTSIRYVEKWYADVDCTQETPIAPKGIESVDGKAVLVYE
ncbi:hypothetical protein J1N10_11815 [Carboxylicivirga sp. A043]|uniref:hypothetical protein n=1 Tax=Carboxylicivirga litoralis TaxID=2816963 RepID=UPI0021CB712E|nr:hypothetical protein [Carboxylicivirga sp. A043]MCU4156665.1 hypothetical protein [Carboxylicivirga sp. A043]